MTLKDLNELINRNDKITYSDLKLLLAKINYSIEEEIDNLSEEERKQMINDMFKGLE